MFGGFGSSNPTTPFGGGFGATTTTTFGQPSTNTFGTPSNTFGSTPSTPSFGTGFGTSTGFGQPSTTTGFGATPTPSFGTSFGATPTGFGTGFGATSTGFGQPTSPGGFGTPSTTPSTGFGATSTPSTGLFGSTTFGSQPPSTGLFGSTAPSTGGGLFGSTPSTTAPSTTGFGGNFGNTTPSTGFGFGATAPSNTGFGLTGTQSGTGNPPYKPTPDPDSGTGPALNMVSLTAMQNYQGKSFEELRWEDYQLKKNTGNFSNTMSTGPGFGTTLGTTPSTGTGLFGSNTPAFGSQPTTAPSTSTTGFGFGSTTPSNGSLFGSTFGNTPSTSTTGFGSTTPSTGFGSTPSFGSSTTSPFGTTNTTSNPTSTFGQPSSTTSTFGQPSNSSSSFNFGSSFGTTNPSTGSNFSFPGQQPTAPSTSAPSFSFSTTPSTGATTTSSSFMPSNNLFSTPNNSSSLFGSTTPSLSSFGTPSNSGVQTGLFGGPSPSLGTPSLGFNSSSNPSSISGYGTGFPSLGVQQKQATITGSPFGTVPVPSLSVNGAPPSPAPSTGATITPTTNKVKKTAPSPHFKLTPRSAAKMKPRGFTASSSLGKQGLEATMSPDIFVPRESIKKLTIDMSVSEEEHEKPVKQIQSSSSSVVSTISKETRSFGGSTSPINLSGLNSSQITPQSTPHNKSAITPITEIIQKPIAKRGPIEQQTLSSIKKVESPISSVEVPKLNRPGYWMSPRVDELCRYSSEQLSAVENFTIGLEDVGSVQFVGQTDVRNLDLDKIVEFSRGEIVVYPDEHLKPPVGEGLNKTAVITLHGCFPLDRATMRPKLDEDSLSRYEAKIIKSTSKLGATFINYDKRSGNWVFQVQHFSRYGLLDDSEDEEENTNTTNSKLQQYGSMVMDKFPISQPVFTTPTPNRFKIGESDSEIEDQNEQPLAEEVMDEIPTASLEEGEVAHEEQQEEDDDGNLELAENEQEVQEIPVEEEEEENTNYEDIETIPKLPSQLGINASKLKAMRNVFFAEDLSGKTDASPSRPFESPVERDSLPKKATIPWRDDPKSDFQITTDFRTQDSILKVEPRKSDSISNKKQHMIADSGLFLGRSFRVCFGTNGLFVHCGRPTGSQNPPATFSTVTIEKLEILPRTHSKETKKQYIHLLDSQLQSSRIHLNENRVPTLSIEDLNIYLNTTISTLDKILSSSNENTQTDFEEHARTAFTLIRALWGKDFSADSFFKCTTKYMCDDPNYPELLARRMSINNWLKSSVVPSVTRDIKACKNPVDSIFFHLTGKQIKDAVSTAISIQDLRMSTLVAQAFSNSTIRDDMANQINLWQNNGISKHISDSRMRIFKLLSGDVNSVSQGLDWKRSFGFHYWYAHPTNAPISSSVSTYERAFSRAFCSAPIPPYLESSNGLLPHKFDQINTLNMVALTDDNTLYIWNKKSGIYKKKNKEGNTWIKVEKDEDITLFKSSKFVSIFPMSWDINYYILKIFSDSKNWKDTILFNQIYYSKHSTPYVLDARLNWHIHCILRSLDNSVNPEQKLFVDYASQLEASGLWQWAVYVFLYLPQSSIRDKLIQNIISRHADELDDAQEFLVSKLSIPISWIEEAKSWQSCNERNFYMQAKYLIKAEKYTESLDVVIHTLAPECILKGETEELREVLLQIEKSASNIPEWKTSGILFIEFLIIERKLKDILTGLVADQMDLYEMLENLEKRVYSLCDLLKSYANTINSDSLDSEKRNLERICLAEMGSKLSGFLVSIKKMLNLDELTQSRRLLQVAPMLLNISLPEDARLMHLNELTRFYLRDQVECLGL